MTADQNDVVDISHFNARVANRSTAWLDRFGNQIFN
jgi:hypothetical protein